MVLLPKRRLPGGVAMSTHTPGPWRWDAGPVPPDGPERYSDIYVDGGETIIARFNELIPEGRANAKLIAAAPVLLAALIKIRSAQIGIYGIPEPALIEADEAIAAATI